MFTDLSVLALLLVIGIVLVAGGLMRNDKRERKASDTTVCPNRQCGHRNAHNAVYCARCGCRLDHPGDS